MKGSKFEQPKISFHAIRHAWFNYAGRAYPVISAPAGVFSAASWSALHNGAIVQAIAMCLSKPSSTTPHDGGYSAV